MIVAHEVSSATLDHQHLITCHRRRNRATEAASTAAAVRRNEMPSLCTNKFVLKCVVYTYILSYTFSLWNRLNDRCLVCARKVVGDHSIYVLWFIGAINIFIITPHGRVSLQYLRPSQQKFKGETDREE